MSEPIPHFGLRRRFRSGLLARDLLFCVLLGIVIILVASLAFGAPLPPIQFGLSIFASLVIYAVAQTLLQLLERWISRWTGIRHLFLLAGVWFVAAALSYFFVVSLQVLARHDSFHLPVQRTLFQILVSGIIAVVAGLLLYTIDLLRSRLAESVARLKEAEFAERELQLARRLQSRLLPPPEIEGDCYRIAARNLAARVVAGDFYDVFPLAGGALGVVVADVAGKGMAASLIMASVKAMLPFVAAERTPEEALRELNRRMAAELSPREFVALAYARFDPSTGTLVLANAGLPDPCLLPPGEPAREVEVPGPRLPLGVRREVAYQSLEATLAPGERLLLFTDGLPEAPAADGEPLGYTALAGLLDAGSSPIPAEWLEGPSGTRASGDVAQPRRRLDGAGSRENRSRDFAPQRIRGRC